MSEVPFTIDYQFLEEVREAVLQYARTHYGSSGLSPEDLTQEALLTTFKKVHEGTLTRLTSSLKTYVIGVLKKKAFEGMKEMSKMPSFQLLPKEDEDDVPDAVDISLAQRAIDRWQTNDDEEDKERLKEAVREMVINMPDPCKTILWSYYWEGNSMREIADLMGYANARVATTQKSRCMDKVNAAMERIINGLRL